jgi:hypothetical protein
VIRRVYWPVYWHETDDGPEHLAFLDNEEMAKMMVKMFEVVKVRAAVHPPVRLNLIDAFPEDLA